MQPSSRKFIKAPAIGTSFDFRGCTSKTARVSIFDFIAPIIELVEGDGMESRLCGGKVV
jgi:hypothetical protein